MNYQIVLQNKFLVSFLFMVAATSAGSADSLLNRAACSTLLEVARTQHLATERTGGHYRCAPHFNHDRKFRVFQLQYVGGEPPGWLGSANVGWFAVRVKDETVVEWDMVMNGAGRTIYPRQK